MEPLGLPRGSVRALLAIIAVLGAVASALMPAGELIDKLIVLPVCALAAYTVYEYHRSREKQNKTDGPREEYVGPSYVRGDDGR